MGEYNKATHAYMIPLVGEGDQFKDDDIMTHTLSVVKIPADGVAAFRKKFWAIKWGALYSMTDSTALKMFEGMNDENTGKRKKK